MLYRSNFQTIFPTGDGLPANPMQKTLSRQLDTSCSKGKVMYLEDTWTEKGASRGTTRRRSSYLHKSVGSGGGKSALKFPLRTRLSLIKRARVSNMMMHVVFRQGFFFWPSILQYTINS